MLAARVRVAGSLWSRIKGLLGRQALEAGEGLVLPRCRSIHTCGMRFAIDAIFVDKDFRVVALKRGIGPWRVVPPVWRAWGVVEVAAGTLARLGLKLGDHLCLVEA